MSAFFNEIHARYGKPEAFIRALRSRMALHCITQGQIAERAGYSTEEVARWLGSGKRSPSMGSMVILDEAMESLIRGD